MKLTKFLFIFTAVAVMFASCKTEDEVAVTGITLDSSTLTLNVDETATLVATLLPKGASATITWTTSDASVATVADGVVTGVSKGTANVVASAGSFTVTCYVTVTQTSTSGNSLKGSAYFPIVLDGVTASTIGSKIVADFRPDELSKFLYIWDNTYTGGTSVGPNFYGEVESWVSLVVGSVGWSGAGFFSSDQESNNKLAAITADPTNYYLHIGIKSKDNAVHVFGMDGQSNAKFAIGATAFNDNGEMTQPIADFPRDGEWHEIEIPMSTLKEKGLLYSAGMGDKNILFVLSGGTPGITLDLDAVFIYKK